MGAARGAGRAVRKTGPRRLKAKSRGRAGGEWGCAAGSGSGMRFTGRGHWVMALAASIASMYPRVV